MLFHALLDNVILVVLADDQSVMKIVVYKMHCLTIRACMPGFLKLLFCDCQYVWACVYVRPQGHK